MQLKTVPSWRHRQKIRLRKPYNHEQDQKSTVQLVRSRYVTEASLNHILTNGWSFVGSGQAKRPWSPCKLEVLHLFRWSTHTHHTHITHSHSHPLTVHEHTYIHTNSPTITAPSLLCFLFPSCFSMISLSLKKLVTCGVIRSFNCDLWRSGDLKALAPTVYELLKALNIDMIVSRQREAGGFCTVVQ